MRRPLCWLAGVFFLMLSLFVGNRNWKESVYHFLETEIFLSGKIWEKQEKETFYGKGWELILTEVSLKKGNKVQKLKGKYLLRLTTEDTYYLGQNLLVKATYSPWEEITNPGQFDLGKWYHSQGILGEFKGKDVIQKGNTHNKWRETLWQIRGSFTKVLLQLLGQKDGSLLSAMILGEKSFLEEESKEMYQRNGISHILAISGLHLMLLGNGIYEILKRILLIPKVAETAACGIMILFCIFSGASISTIRATIMFVMTLWAKNMGRAYDSLSALALAALVLLWQNPYVMENSGFLLSFLAVIGVVIVAPGIKEIFPYGGKIWDSLMISISASLTTLPILLINYGTFSWYSIFLNLLILPPMAFLLGGGVILILLSYFMSFSGQVGILLFFQQVLIFSLRMILDFYELCCKLFERLPFQDSYLGAAGSLRILLYYVFLFLFLRLLCSKSSPLFHYPPFWNRIFLLLLVTFLTCSIPGKFEITMLDVGQGDCLIIRNSNQKVYLSDGGSSSVSRVGKYRILPFLKNKGYGRLEAVFISHLDGDHYNGILELLQQMEAEKIKIGYLVLPGEVKKQKDQREKLEELLLLAKKNRIQMIYMNQGDTFKDEKMIIHCIHPAKGKGRGDSNDDSLVLELSYGEFDVLLTGDVEASGEEKIIEYLEKREEEEEKTYEVLKVAHHGSAGSSTELFLGKIKPILGLISCGKNNRYGHPAKEALERLEEQEIDLLDTRNTGAITIMPKKDGSFRIRTFLDKSRESNSIIQGEKEYHNKKDRKS